MDNVRTPRKQEQPSRRRDEERPPVQQNPGASGGQRGPSVRAQGSSAIGTTAPQIHYDRASNCGNSTNCGNTTTTTTTINNGGSDPLASFAEAHCAAGAAFNSRRLEHEPLCLKDTRAVLLDDIMQWSDCPNETCIFWLSGMAGTGKSTIARTVARTWHDKQQLGASFFFSKGQGDLAHASKFFPTLAYQLARAHSSLAANIQEAIRVHPDITGQILPDQWKHLIREPLSQLKDRREPLIVVIDALDECDGDDDIARILQLLSQAKTLPSSAPLLVFVTSRPETPIRLGFNIIPAAAHRDCILHEISSQAVDEDITALLRHEFAKIRENCHQSHEWPGDSNLKLLVEKANGLFIYAATVCRFVGEKALYTSYRLAAVLQDTGDTGGPTQHLDSIYTTVLQCILATQRAETEEEVGLAKLFQRIVGSIVLLSDMLPAPALGQLLKTQQGEVEIMLECLSSVLSYSHDTPIRLLHPSFRDFLLDSRRCRDCWFRIVGTDAHRSLAIDCLALMSTKLKKDICTLRLPGSLISEVDRDTINRCLPKEVQYACRYWVDHLQQGTLTLGDSELESLHEQVHAFLNQHFLHWLEALSLVGKLAEGVLIVKKLESLLPSKADLELRAMAHDAVRFVLSYRSTIEIAPLQVYCSALLLSPERSTIRKKFWDYVPSWITIPSAVRKDWDSTLQVLAGHSSEVKAVAFSPDGKVLASASMDHTVRLWDLMTGACHASLEGHTSYVNGVSFSPNGKALASASSDETVRLWDPMTGTCRASFVGNSGCVWAVAFSPDGKVLASSAGKIVQLWDPIAETCLASLGGHSRRVLAIAFSPDSKTLASASDDTTVRLWDPTARTCRATLNGHSGKVIAVAFTPDGGVLASVSYDGTVRLWDLMTKSCHTLLKCHAVLLKAVTFSPNGKALALPTSDGTIQLWDPKTRRHYGTLGGHSGDVLAVAFSLDGTVLASASDDRTVRVWDPIMGTSCTSLEGHSSTVTSVIFSHDGNVLASASQDSTVRLWDATTGSCWAILEGHSEPVWAVAFSPDGRVLASASSDYTVRLWDLTTGGCRAILKGHSDEVLAVAFSPDGKDLASASFDKTVRLWDPATGSCRAILKGHSEATQAVAFSPDSKILASASVDCTVRLWDTVTGTCCSSLEGHSSWVNTVAFTRDGRILASASRDTTVRLWDPMTGTCHAILVGHSWSVDALSFSPNGKVLTSATRDHSVLYWDVDMDPELPKVPMREISHSQSTLLVYGRWICFGTRRLFLLPADCSAKNYAAQNNIIALAYPAGRISFIKFDLDRFVDTAADPELWVV